MGGVDSINHENHSVRGKSVISRMIYNCIIVSKISRTNELRICGFYEKEKRSVKFLE